MVLHPQSGMRVLMTTDAVGGVWSYCLSLAASLRDYGVQIALATMGPAPSEAQRQDVGRLANVELCESGFKLEWMREPWEDVDRAGDWLLSLDRQFRPDVIHLNGYVHAVLPWSSPVLVVAHSCVGSWFEAVRQSPPTAEWDEYMRRVARGLRHADLVTAPTRAALDALGRHYGPFRSAEPIFNGCDGLGRPARRREKIVLAAGRLWDPAKGIASLDLAARDIRWPVLAAGATEGPDGQRAQLETVQTLGSLDRQALHRWYERASIFVLPSVYEPFGLTALEAALAGCALVLSDIPTLREIWADAAAFVPPGDHESLAREVNRLIVNTRLRGEYVQRARRKARSYTLARMADRYHRVYLDLIHAAGASVTLSVDNLAGRPAAVTGA